MREPVTLLVVVTGCAAAVGAAVGAVTGRARAKERQALADRQGARGEAERLRAEAEREAAALVAEAEISAREAALAMRAETEAALQRREEELARRATALVKRQSDVEARTKEIAAQLERLALREAPLADGERVVGAHEAAAAAADRERRERLERLAGERTEDLRSTLRAMELDEARGQAAQVVRLVEQGAQDPQHGRYAKRVMGIAIGRFAGHYLTERHLSVVPLFDVRRGPATIPETDLEAIGQVAGVKLTLTEERNAVRLEGLDGVGREIARRTLARLLKRPGTTGPTVTRIAREIGVELEREVLELGRRAFTVLEIPRAHPDIVKLVGRLNWRTSYTQNQWKHAIEAAFLCGMMAEELGLDLKVARRAALMHDIGKALTHELDGSHAVIGAEYARRLGETELVANAIGAHHTDEPFSSPYAYLVAAADAMSGARPGARRQTEDNYVAKIADLERISRNFGGVAEAFAVQGGREVRVIVHEDRVGDADAIALSAQIAERISSEMAFPGQIRVTVIREFRAVETAN